MDLSLLANQKNLSHHPFLIAQTELASLDNYLKESVQASSSRYFSEVCEYLLQTPGKRLRPILVFLAGSVTENNNNLLPIGAAVELLHMATLIHDDVIDKADMRRGRQSVNDLYGNHVAVLLGDYCYGKSLEFISMLGDDYTQLFAEVINKLVEGEFLQYESINEPYVALTNYWDRIYNKTAFFFSVCCRMGAMASGASKTLIEVLDQYGECLGMAFQIRDDLLDITESGTVLGKPTGNDMQNGVLTLPIIHALNFSKNGNNLIDIIKRPVKSDDDVAFIRAAIEETGAIEYTRSALRQYVNLALQSLEMLPEGQSKFAMEELAKQISC